MTCGFLWHERSGWHDVGALAAHAPPGRWVEPDVALESAASKRRVRNLIDVSGLLAQLRQLPFDAASEDALRRVHTDAYLERLRAGTELGGGEAGEGAPYGAMGYEIARLGAGACVASVDAVLGGEVDRTYALVRPPGHHAEPDRGRGFCLLANLAIAGRHALDHHGLDRIATVDFDVHHGNGTQLAFWDDPSALTISIHQDRSFPPDSGLASELGGVGARGSVLNVPLPPGCGLGAYVEAFDRLILPALRRFEPQLLLLSCGYDAGILDPYGRMLLTSEGFATLAQRLVDVADEICGGAIVAVHEGGYSTAHAPFCTLAVLERLSGWSTPVEDPFLEPEFAQPVYQELQPHQAVAIDRIAAELGVD